MEITFANSTKTEQKERNFIDYTETGVNGLSKVSNFLLFIAIIALLYATKQNSTPNRVIQAEQQSVFLLYLLFFLSYSRKTEMYNKKLIK